MTGKELRTALDILGWDKVELAERIGAHRNSVSRWLKRGCPIVVARYLKLKIAIKKTEDL